ncbi:hypothetical protein POM88_012519 [Heracleum sosnowskyi]|uniref:Uncharacterized protein n=1 Tax=Heracleum sosnowskyi TaxID=360622 RepID=A0AAD8IYU1_9APIA|nr:hypothetical protein POM88_012519 [Heracleum sosnowskyi]
METDGSNNEPLMQRNDNLDPAIIHIQHICYIRPGCIILTVYLRMEKSSWEKLCCDLKFILTFAYDGQVLLDTPLPSKNDKNCKIVSVKPLAVSVSKKVLFLVKGYNISSSNTRLLCALEGKYLVHQDSSGLTDRAASSTNYEEEMQCISFSCSIPDVIGRGFVEVMSIPSFCSVIILKDKIISLNYESK